MRVTVIIPTINEQETTGSTIRSAWSAGADEVVVADGGSTDNTLKIARALDCKIAVSQPARGIQLNAGTQLATGDVFLFLHADNRLGENVCQQIKQLDDAFVFGAFRQKIAARGWKYRWIEKGNEWRVRWRGLAYGDQGVFVARQPFEAVGGFPDFRLMEDVALSDQLKKMGWPILLDGPIEVDARRWIKNGAFRQTIKNWYLFTRYRLGTSPDKLAAIYGRHDAKTTTAEITVESQGPSHQPEHSQPEA